MDAHALDIATAAARLAGEELLSAWRGELEVLAEDANDIKLAMDRRAEAVILETIRAAFPDHSFLCEESGETEGEGDTQWVIDPLDGTHNYFRRIPCWCVCVGAVRNGVPALGVIYDPVHDHMFTAEAGKGAFLNGERISVSGRESLRGSVVAYGIYHSEETSARAWLRRSRTVTPLARSLRTLGSAGLHCAYVAAGWMDAYVQYGVSPWDVTAGFALVTEAGGAASSWPVENAGGLDVALATPAVYEELMATGLWPLEDEGE